jgi:hypothetical protein
MTQYMTNKDLLDIRVDIDRMLQQPAFAIFLGPKVKRFMEQNKLRIDMMIAGCQNLIDKHVVKNDKGAPEFVAYKESHKFRFKSDEDEQEYIKAYDELMAKSFDVYL